MGGQARPRRIVRGGQRPAGLAGIAAALAQTPQVTAKASPVSGRGRRPYAFKSEQDEWIGRMVHDHAIRGVPLDDPKPGERGDGVRAPKDHRDFVDRHAYVQPEGMDGVVGALTIVAATVRRLWGRDIQRDAVDRIYKAWRRKHGMRGIPRLRREYRDDDKSWVSRGDLPLFPDSPGWGRPSPAMLPARRTALSGLDRMRLRAYLVLQMTRTTDPRERRYFDDWLRQVDAAI